MTIIPLQEFLEDLERIQQYTFDKDLYVYLKEFIAA
jgi:hypothetical protein